MDKYQMFNELLQDEEKAKQVVTESIEETRKNLMNLGMDFTVEELRSIAELAEKQSAKNEISVEDLDQVNGGIAGLCAAALFFWGVACFANMCKAWL